MLEKFERIKLGHFPTPIEHLKNISKYLGGPNIFIKRDDCTGLATGGNKTRKLEFLIPDAIKNKAELVVTVGAVQSNHARQTAAACTLMGLKCLIILEQRVKDPPEVYMNSGNVFLNKLYGADTGWFVTSSYQRTQNKGNGYSNGFYFAVRNKPSKDIEYAMSLDNDKTFLDYKRNINGFDFTVGSNYSLFSEIPDYAASLKISSTF